MMIRKPVLSLDQVEAAMKAAPEKAKRDAPKEFLIEMGETGLYHIKLSAGGEVPDSLKGSFTGISRARAAIDNHKATQEAAV